jgi:hypothetical protein
LKRWRSEGVNIDMISTSEIKISVVIDLAKGEQAMKAVHAAFVNRNLNLNLLLNALLCRAAVGF